MSAATQGRTFEAGWDWVVWTITAFTIALLVSIAAAIVYQGAGHGSSVLGYSISAGFAVLLFLSWFFAPARYVLTGSELIIKTHGPALRFSRKGMGEAQVITKRRGIGLALRCGDGGLFGIYGLYWSSRLGAFHCWCTRTRPLVLIQRKEGWPILISPNDPEKFVSSLSAIPPLV